VKIRILESIASSVEGGFGPGDVVDWGDKKEAEHLIKTGVAEPAREKRGRKETATPPDVHETASLD